MPRLSIVIPAHNDSEILEQTLDDLTRYIDGIALSPCSFIIIENGSKDNSAEILGQIIARGHKNRSIKIYGDSLDEAGIGYALNKGIEIALNNFGPKDHWIMLTASDLPFGSTDLEEFLKSLQQNNTANFFIGSKAHQKSKVDRGFKRWLVGKVFYLLRRIILGMKTGDPQGVFFIKGEVISTLLPKIRSRNFFYTTELTYFAEKSGELIVELPVVYQGERRPSSVRVIKHGLELVRNIFELKSRKAT